MRALYWWWCFLVTVASILNPVMAVRFIDKGETAGAVYMGLATVVAWVMAYRTIAAGRPW